MVDGILDGFRISKIEIRESHGSVTSRFLGSDLSEKRFHLFVVLEDGTLGLKSVPAVHKNGLSDGLEGADGLRVGSHCVLLFFCVAVGVRRGFTWGVFNSDLMDGIVDGIRISEFRILEKRRCVLLVVEDDLVDITAFCFVNLGIKHGKRCRDGDNAAGNTFPNCLLDGCNFKVEQFDNLTFEFILHAKNGSGTGFLQFVDSVLILFKKSSRCVEFKLEIGGTNDMSIFAELGLAFIQILQSFPELDKLAEKFSKVGFLQFLERASGSQRSNDNTFSSFRRCGTGSLLLWFVRSKACAFGSLIAGRRHYLIRK
mmetsp:Transcript_13423/g.32333  ORF Transcript_13423/g.32333 Transcript_13423/m.32333 type:complete len:313 (+) Transcript_13423:3854-4792(+)